MSDLIPDEEQLAEANKRYPTDHEVDDPHGETGVARSDPYGYDATANEAFLEGAMWERARRVSPVTREALEEKVRLALDDALLCGRVWEAWGYGTMTQDDFSPAAEDPEFVAQIVNALLSVSPPAEVTDEMVEKAAQAFGGLTTTNWSDAEGWERRAVRGSTRAALTAALGVPEEAEHG